MGDDQKAFKKRLKQLMNLPENQVCSDCTERQPRWASLIVPPPGAPEGSPSFGAFVCLECSGSHRRLGVHITFVRSINLDSWKEKEVLAMENGGNNKVNTIFESRLNVEKPTNHADLNTRERYIRDKYERRKFYDPAAFSKVVATKPPQAAPKAAPAPAPQQDVSFHADFSNTGSVGQPSAAAQRRLAQRRGSGAEGAKERRPPNKMRSKSSVDGPVADLLDFSNDAPKERRVQRKKSKDFSGDASVLSAPDKRGVQRRKSKDDMSLDGGLKRGVARRKSKDKDLMAFGESTHSAPPAKNDFADFAVPASGAKPKAEKPKASSQDIMSLYNTAPTPAMNNGNMNMQNNMANMTNMMQQMNMQNNMMAAQQQNAARMAQAQMTPQQMQQQAMMYQQHMRMLQNMQGGMAQQQMGGMMMPQQQQQMGMMPQQQQQPVAASGGNGQNMGGMGQQPAENKDPFASLGAQGFR